MTGKVVTEDTFDKDVIEQSKTIPVVVDFWAPWCMPCKILGPVIGKLAVEYKDKFVLATVNVDENPLLANTYGIRSIPTVLLFKDGKHVDGFAGAVPEQSIRKWLERNNIIR